MKHGKAWQYWNILHLHRLVHFHEIKETSVTFASDYQNRNACRDANLDKTSPGADKPWKFPRSDVPFHWVGNNRAEERIFYWCNSARNWEVAVIDTSEFFFPFPYRRLLHKRSNSLLFSVGTMMNSAALRDETITMRCICISPRI